MTLAGPRHLQRRPYGPHLVRLVVLAAALAIIAVVTVVVAVPLQHGSSNNATSNGPGRTSPGAGGTPSARHTEAGPMPTGSPKGYKRIFADDFNRTSLGSNWEAYQGQPGTDAGGWWSPSHVTVNDGEMVLSAYKDAKHYGGPASDPPWVEGGVSSRPAFKLKYGEYLVRSKVTWAAGVTEVDLLWPADNNWPPEVDFNESHGVNGAISATLHYGRSEADRIQYVLRKVNLKRWHTWGVIWSPGKLVYTVDGKTWATVTSSHVPSEAMVLDIQQQIWPCNNDQKEACPGSGTPGRVNLDVAWVVAYAPTS